MNWLWICSTGLAVGVYLWMRFASRVGKPLSDLDLMQAARQIGKMKKAALANFVTIEKPEVPGSADPRTSTTEAGHRLLYTVSHDTPGKYVHHGSVSVAAGYEACAVGELLVLLWSKLLGIHVGRLVLSRSQRLVHHAEFILDEAEHQQLARQPVEPPTVEWLQALRSEWTKVRGELKWVPANVELRPLDQNEVATLKAQAQEAVGILYEVVCGLDQYKRFGAVTDTAEVKLTLIVCLSLRAYFSKIGMAAAQGPTESSEVWSALACAVAGDLEKAAIPVAKRDRSASAEVPVRFPRGVCAFVHERLVAGFANAKNPDRELVRAAELFRAAAEGSPS